jgi:hypothetical protein
MKTYQDLQSVAQTEKALGKFIWDAINEHKASAAYHIAFDAEEYDHKRNVTMLKYQKLLYTMSGRAVPDNFSANHKIVNAFFPLFVTQQTQYLLGNGLKLEEMKNKERLGKNFDSRFAAATRDSLVQGVAFGFWNLDHLESFKLTEFVPLWDENTGRLCAGIRFWQNDSTKPLHAMLFELDGVSEWVKVGDKAFRLEQEKRSYKITEKANKNEGVTLLDGGNYPGFPVIPLWGNVHHQSELVGIRTKIDAYDLIESGFANDWDDASMMYWTLENAGGMDDVDLARFVERMKTVKAAVIDGDEGAKAEAHTMEVPHVAREAILSRLSDDLHRDFGALNIRDLSGGNKTTVEIKAAYQMLDNKCDQQEYLLHDFLFSLFELIGIDDTPSFNRSRIINQLEETQTVLMAAQYLDEETLLKKLPFLTPEDVEELLKNKAANDAERLMQPPVEPPVVGE